MKKFIFPVFLIVIFFLIHSCELFDSDNGGLSQSEIVEGLKEALEIGSGNATSALSAADGYYGDPLVRIPLPEEAEFVRATINSNGTLAGISDLIGLEDAFENVILGVNRAAEDAADDALPIFSDAITSMTISDGWTILNGTNPLDNSSSGQEFDSTAATGYFRSKTYQPLSDAFSPKVNTSLQKDIVGSVSAYDAWADLTGLYNNFMGRSDVQTAISIANLFETNIDLPASINDDLGEFCTQKALDGLFFMVGEEEKKIRKDPWAWASGIIEKVFGYIYEQ